MATKANAEFFEALRLLEKEKGIPGDYLLEKGEITQEKYNLCQQEAKELLEV